MLPGGFQDGLLVDHHAQIDDFEPVAPQDDARDVLADVVDIPLHRRMDDDRPLHGLFAGFHVRLQQGHCVLHHLGRLDDLREEHLPLAEPPSHLLHSGHQRPLDDLYGRSQPLQRGGDELGKAVGAAGEEGLLKGALVIGKLPGRGRA